jgi:hypothetical protein
MSVYKNDCCSCTLNFEPFRSVLQEDTAMKNHLICALVVSSAALMPVNHALSQVSNLSGFCLDVKEEGCTPRFVPFTGMSIDFCEESCSLGNATPIRNLDAVLYEKSCIADWGRPDMERVLIIQQTDHSGQSKISWVDQYETLDIVRCP